MGLEAVVYLFVIFMISMIVLGEFSEALESASHHVNEFVRSFARTVRVKFTARVLRERKVSDMASIVTLLQGLFNQHTNAISSEMMTYSLKSHEDFMALKKEMAETLAIVSKNSNENVAALHREMQSIRSEIRELKALVEESTLSLDVPETDSDRVTVSQSVEQPTVQTAPTKPIISHPLPNACIPTPPTSPDSFTIRTTFTGLIRSIRWNSKDMAISHDVQMSGMTGSTVRYVKKDQLRKGICIGSLTDGMLIVAPFYRGEKTLRPSQYHAVVDSGVVEELSSRDVIIEDIPSNEEKKQIVNITARSQSAHTLRREVNSEVPAVVPAAIPPKAETFGPQLPQAQGPQQQTVKVPRIRNVAKTKTSTRINDNDAKLVGTLRPVSFPLSPRAEVVFISSSDGSLLRDSNGLVFRCSGSQYHSGMASNGYVPFHHLGADGTQKRTGFSATQTKN